MKFFVGGYGTDLIIADLDPSDGTMEVLGRVTVREKASFLLHVPEFDALYSTGESGYETGESGTIAVHRVAADGGLMPIGSLESRGVGPCHVDADPRRRILTAANYGGASIAALSVRRDGTLESVVACARHTGSSVNPDRQAEPHPHATTFSPDRTYLFVPDLGTDTIMRYESEAFSHSGDLHGVVAAKTRAGSGPRHLAFSRDGRFLHLVTELANTVAVYGYERDTGALTELQEISTLPAGFAGVSTSAEIQLHPNGRFLYTSNRGHDSIAVFGRDPDTGALSASGHVQTQGNNPRHFQVDRTGNWCLVANQSSNNVVSFRVDPDSGGLTWTGRSMQADAPSCCEFMRT